MIDDVTDTTAQRPRPLQSALAKPAFRRLIASMALSSAGDWLYNIALLVFVFERTGSATWVAIATIMRLAPYVLFGAVGGAIADRNDGRRVMIVSDLVRAALMVGLVLVATTDAPVFLAVVFAFLTTAGGTAYLPTVVKAVPSMVSEHDLAGANAVRSTVDNASVVVGPAVGGAVLALGSPTWAFAANALTFLLSAVVVRGLRPLPPEDTEGPETLLQAIAGGWGVLRSSAIARWLVGVSMCVGAIYGLQTVFLVLVSEDLLDAGTSGIGYLYAALGLGGVIVAGLTARLANARRPSLVLSVGTLASALPLVALATVGNVPAAVVVVAVQGAAWVVLEVVLITTLQRTLPAAAIARVYGIADALLVLSMLIGSIAAPALVSALDLKGALLATGISFSVVGVAMLPSLLGMDGAAETRRSELAPHVRLLQSLSIFEGAPLRALESLAAAAVREEIPADQVIVQEGEPATAFYVMVEGGADVLSTGEGGVQRVINSVDAGDYFGEIGLLRQLPRTATVLASVDCVVERIDGDAFLEAVRGEERIGSALEPRIVIGLRRTHPSYAPEDSGAA